MVAFPRAVIVFCNLGSVHKLREGGMGDLRRGGEGPESFLHRKREGGGGAEMLPEQ